jgi:hypothetical protein
MAVPTKLALSLGRDFDGDFVQLINAKKYPHIVNAIESIPLPPVTVKFPKIALKGNLQDVAIGSMTDKTGIVASLIAQTKVLGLENEQIFLPLQYGDPNYGKVKNAKKQMRLIDFLSQQLQIAVDSLKSAYPNNTVGLDHVRDFLKLCYENAYSEEERMGFDKISPWLKSLKDRNTFASKPCDVLADAPDTISQLVRLVNSYWQQFVIKYEDRIPKKYQNALFYHIKSDKKQDQLAEKHTEWYKDFMGKAMDECKALAARNIYTNLPIRVVNNRVREFRKKLEEDSEHSKFTIQSWAAAYWRAANRRMSGKASMVFTMFHEEIIEELKNYGSNIPDHIIVYDIPNYEFKHSTYKWTGEKVTMQITQNEGDKFELCEIFLENATRLTGFHVLGKVAYKYKTRVKVGETRAMRVFTTKIGREATGDKSTWEVALIDPDADEKRIGEILHDNRRKKNNKEVISPY